MKRVKSKAQKAIARDRGPASTARPRAALSKAARLKLFDETTAWLEERQRLNPVPPSATDDRGWTRDDIYSERLDRLRR